MRAEARATPGDNGGFSFLGPSNVRTHANIRHPVKLDYLGRGPARMVEIKIRIFTFTVRGLGADCLKVSVSNGSDV